MIYLILTVAVVLAVFAFAENCQHKKMMRSKNHPDFTPYKIDKEKIKDKNY